MRRHLLLSVSILLLLIICSCSAEDAQQQSTIAYADIVLVNGNIITMDENMPKAEAVAVKDGKILLVGSSAAIQELTDEETEVIQLNGATVIPGFIEGHGHLHNLGKLKMNLDLTATQNFDEVVELVRNAAAEAAPGEWIIGRGWHQEKWNKPLDRNVQGYPYHDRITAVSPDNPVYLDHASGHVLLANKRAMELAGVWQDAKDTVGGLMRLDKEGNPIGIFEENAEGFIKRPYEQYLSSLTEEERFQRFKKAYKAAEQEALSKGVTSFTDAGLTVQEVKYLQRLKKDDELQLRIYGMLYEPIDILNAQTNTFPIIDTAENILTVRAIKVYMDGALGSRGAWLLKPYTDDPDNTGQAIISTEELKNIGEFAAENNMQLCTHAIGDRANREVLNIYEELINKHQDEDLRWRIEHAQHIDPADIPRFASLNVIPSMQAIHCISDATFVEKRLGKERAEAGAYVWRKLIDSGAIIANGTDTPVEDISPIQNYYASVTRIPLNGSTPFYPSQSMTRDEALRSLTINNAYAAFEENIKGSIEQGKLADFTVLSQDITKVPQEDILDIQILYTISGGNVVFQAAP